MVEILWHRRETRRQTENTNFNLQHSEEPAYSPTPSASTRSPIRAGSTLGGSYIYGKLPTVVKSDLELYFCIRADLSVVLLSDRNECKSANLGLD